MITLTAKSNSNIYVPNTSYTFKYTCSCTPYFPTSSAQADSNKTVKYGDDSYSVSLSGVGTYVGSNGAYANCLKLFDRYVNHSNPDAQNNFITLGSLNAAVVSFSFAHSIKPTYYRISDCNVIGATRSVNSMRS
jgi:hypothetical protein